jgi:hypothetical protein
MNEEQKDPKAPVQAASLPSSLPSGNNPEMLREMGGWNWGACSLTWIWMLVFGMTDWGLIVMAGSLLIPCGAIVASIYLGMKGNELAWRYKSFSSMEEFQTKIHQWNMYGIVFLVVTSVIAFAASLWLVFYLKGILEKFYPAM